MAAQAQHINDLEYLRKLSTMKILFVDDKKNMVKTLENMVISICAFKRKSQSVFRAYNGEEACNAIFGYKDIKKNYMDMVLLDWNMPIMPGINVLRAIRTSKDPKINNIPIIMITGEAVAKDVNNAIYEGADGYLLKPFMMDDLRKKMNNLLRRYWSGQKMLHAQTKRSEIRYDADRLKLMVQVEFYDSNEMEAPVLNLSHKGARVDIGSRHKPEIKSITFPELGNPELSTHKIDAISFMPEKEEIKNQVSLFFKYGFKNEAAQDCWTQWVELGRKKDMEFRGQLF